MSADNNTTTPGTNAGRTQRELPPIPTREVIRILVDLIDELRQPYNNSRRHDLYEKATTTLNDLEDRGQLPH